MRKQSSLSPQKRDDFDTAAEALDNNSPNGSGKIRSIFSQTSVTRNRGEIEKSLLKEVPQKSCEPTSVSSVAFSDHPVIATVLGMFSFVDRFSGNKESGNKSR